MTHSLHAADSAASPALLSVDAPRSCSAVRVAAAICRAEPPRVLWGGSAGAETLARLLSASVVHSPAGTAAAALEAWCGDCALMQEQRDARFAVAGPPSPPA